MHWFSSLPEKYCAQIMDKVKKIASAQGDRQVRNDYRVVLRMDSTPQHGRSPRKRPKPPPAPSPPPQDQLTFAVTRFGKRETKLLPIAIPQPKLPRFRSHPYLLSREYLPHNFLEAAKSNYRQRIRRRRCLARVRFSLTT